MKNENRNAEVDKIKDEYVLKFDENFTSNELDTLKWFPYFLPHWSSKKQTAANYQFRGGNLVLQITENQKPWCPELNGDIKCSSIQTGIFSGKLGSKNGQHRFSKDCIVTEEQINKKLFTPQFGYFEIRAKANISKSDMVAFWMIGFEDNPEYAGEICVMEIFGDQIQGESLVNGSGIHPFSDMSLKDEFYHDKLKIDIREFHTFSVEWQPDKVKFFVDNQHVRTINQSPQYPMQFMIDIFHFPKKDGFTVTNYPKEFIIDYVRGYTLKS
jgi:Glycosyl hydrolases family 16